MPEAHWSRERGRENVVNDWAEVYVYRGFRVNIASMVNGTILGVFESLILWY